MPGFVSGGSRVNFCDNRTDFRSHGTNFQDKGVEIRSNGVEIWHKEASFQINGVDFRNKRVAMATTRAADTAGEIKSKFRTAWRRLCPPRDCN
jgi:hypothetical protein